MSSTATLPFQDFVDSFPDTSGYLGACILGLPTRQTRDALSADLQTWWDGGATPDLYGDSVERARASYARFVGVPASWVAIGSQISVQASIVAGSAPAGSRIVCVDGDFSSIVFPFLQQASRGVEVVHADPSGVADVVDERTWAVVFSLVQSATGAVLDGDAIRTAAGRVGALTVCDVTQAAGWLPLDAALYDVTLCHTYKWLCCPRGAALLTVRPEVLPQLTPSQAGWYAGEDVWGSCYGPTMALAPDARRFDVSPAWPAWVGAAVAIGQFASADIERIRRHDVAIADAIRDGLGLPGSTSAIVTWPDPDGRDLAAMKSAGIGASGRAGRARLACHLWNDLDDADAVIACVSGSRG